ncbi:MAG: 3,4-dioxygenase subunit beta [Nocardioides sp.]
MPNETAGPYPGDGSNGTNVLDDTGIVRSDLRPSLAGGTTAAGVPLTFRLTVRDLSSGEALAGAGVYAWHCSREGLYSMYSQGAQDETYLRGVQETDADGTVEFVSVFPGCYAGRWPHIHFEVYDSVQAAVAQDGDNPIMKVSQIALPKETCEQVYATTGYESSVGNLAGVSLATDNVFGDDGGIHQLATIAGDVASGYQAQLAIGVVTA